jgi:hypothetical protein
MITGGAYEFHSAVPGAATLQLCLGPTSGFAHLQKGPLGKENAAKQCSACEHTPRMKAVGSHKAAAPSATFQLL